MSAKSAICSQYLASLEMLKQSVVRCPESLWDCPDDRNRFWHVAFHTLFFTHLYLQRTPDDLKKWERHRLNYQFLGNLPWPPHDKPEIGEPYTKDDVLAYVEFCREQIEEKVPALDLDAESDFPWLPFTKLELQIYNIRHIQQHAGELMERLGARESVDVDWVARME